MFNNLYERQAILFHRDSFSRFNYHDIVRFHIIANELIIVTIIVRFERFKFISTSYTLYFNDLILPFALPYEFESFSNVYNVSLTV